MHSLHNLLEQISYESVKGDDDQRITDICYHSGKVKEGSLFVCINGQRENGHDHIKEALEKGATALVIEEGYLVESSKSTLILTEHIKIDTEELIQNQNICIVTVKDARIALSQLSAAFFDYPAKKMRMIGITGTNGKTTTAYITAGILKEAGYRVGMIGTIVCDDGKKKSELWNTTPESYEIHRLLFQMAENECDCCVMEVSSQGIAMHRTEDIFFDIGIFLNIEPDHIGKGEHASFSEYLYCKSRLMQQCQIGIVNQDDCNVNKILAGHTCEIETFSMKHPADIMAEQDEYQLKNGRLESRFVVKKEWREFPITMQLPGRFNIYNALAAIAAAVHFRVSEAQIQHALEDLVVPGRCENLTAGEPYAFLVDYAHNEMSLRNLLETLRSFKPKRMIVIFGCGGNRSVLRRYQMGETAGRLADFIIITSDNPRWENPEHIIEQIEAGVKEAEHVTSYCKITDRTEAVNYAATIARPDDILILAGKGHETYQEIGGVRYPLEDRKIVENAVKLRNKKTICQAI